MAQVEDVNATFLNVRLMEGTRKDQLTRAAFTGVTLKMPSKLKEPTAPALGQQASSSAAATPAADPQQVAVVEPPPDTAEAVRMLYGDGEKLGLADEASEEEEEAEADLST